MNNYDHVSGVGVHIQNTPDAPQILSVRLAGWVKAMAMAIVIGVVGLCVIAYEQREVMDKIAKERRLLEEKNHQLDVAFKEMQADKDRALEQKAALARELEVVKNQPVPTVDLQVGVAASAPENIFSAPLNLTDTLSESSKRLIETMAGISPDLMTYKQGPYVVVQLQGGGFELGSAELPPLMLEQLALISKVFQAYSGDFYMAVEGHTDTVTGEGKSNWKVGTERAEQVLNAMLRMGVNPEKLALVSRAQYLPKVVTGPEQSCEANRRVELVFAPNRTIRKGQTVATLLQDEHQRAMLYAVRGNKGSERIEERVERVRGEN